MNISQSVFSVRSSNSRALKVAGLTTLACLLLGSQVFTAYMVFGQRQQIRELQGNNQRISNQLTRSNQGNEIESDSTWWQKSGRKQEEGSKNVDVRKRKWDLCFLGLLSQSWSSWSSVPVCLLGPLQSQDCFFWFLMFLFVCFYL